MQGAHKFACKIACDQQTEFLSEGQIILIRVHDLELSQVYFIQNSRGGYMDVMWHSLERTG